MITRRGGFIDQIDRFDAEFFGINPREAARADPQQRLMLQVAYQAVEDAGLTMASLAGQRVGVYVGVSTWDYSLLQSKSEERIFVDAYSNIGTALCIAANRISYFFNLIGPSLAVDTACSSSLVATHLACRGIWNGETELAFVGGVNLLVQPDVTIGFSKASMLSPDGRCKSFDARANGYVRGEGAGVVILKPLQRALADGDRIYAVIRATAVNQDGRTAGISVPSQASQEANIVDALRLADISPGTIQYVEAHGTGTPVGDPIEAAAIGATYGKSHDRAEHCVIGSIKSNFGHLEAAAGMAGLIKATLALQHRSIPGNLHFENPNPNIPFDELQLRVSERLQPWPDTHGGPARAGVNSFGFGGTNGHVILEAPPEPRTPMQRPAAAPAGRAWMLPLSARSAAALPDLARSYLAALAPGGEPGRRGAARHLFLGCRQAIPSRLAPGARRARPCRARRAARSVREWRGARQQFDRPHPTIAVAARLRLLRHGPAMVGDGARAAGRGAGFPPGGRGGQRPLRGALRLVVPGEADGRRGTLAVARDALRAAGDLCAAGRAGGAVAIMGRRARGGVRA